MRNLLWSKLGNKYRYFKMDPIRMAYLTITLLCGVLYISKLNKKLILANQYLVAIVAVVLILEFLLNVFIAWYSGYLYEQIAIYQMYIFFPIEWLQALTICLGLLNFVRKFRTSKNQQIFLICIFVLLATYTLLIYGVPHTFTVSPGWHTSHYPPNFYSALFFYFVIGMLINLLITHFKRLPELKDPIEKDATLDALVDIE